VAALPPVLVAETQSAEAVIPEQYATLVPLATAKPASAEMKTRRERAEERMERDDQERGREREETRTERDKNEHYNMDSSIVSFDILEKTTRF